MYSENNLRNVTHIYYFLLFFYRVHSEVEAKGS